MFEIYRDGNIYKYIFARIFKQVADLDLHTVLVYNQFYWRG